VVIVQEEKWGGAAVAGQDVWACSVLLFFSFFFFLWWGGAAAAGQGAWACSVLLFFYFFFFLWRAAACVGRMENPEILAVGGIVAVALVLAAVVICDCIYIVVVTMAVVHTVK
jgi:hypothetical protein